MTWEIIVTTNETAERQFLIGPNCDGGQTYMHGYKVIQYLDSVGRRTHPKYHSSLDEAIGQATKVSRVIRRLPVVTQQPNMPSGDLYIYTAIQYIYIRYHNNARINMLPPPPPGRGRDISHEGFDHTPGQILHGGGGLSSFLSLNIKTGCKRSLYYTRLCGKVKSPTVWGQNFKCQIRVKFPRMSQGRGGAIGN